MITKVTTNKVTLMGLGATSDDVAALQSQLNRFPNVAIDVTGSMNPATIAAAQLIFRDNLTQIVQMTGRLDDANRLANVFVGGNPDAIVAEVRLAWAMIQVTADHLGLPQYVNITPGDIAWFDFQPYLPYIAVGLAVVAVVWYQKASAAGGGHSRKKK